jgi:predicted Zn-dependent protease
MSNSQGSRLDVTVVGYEFGPSTAYHFVVVTPAGQGLGALSPLVNSVARMSDAEAAAIKPRRVRLVTVRAGDSVHSLAARMGYADYRLERFLVLNGLTEAARLRPGMRVKIVTS